jgi:hypothetical protein
VLESPITEVLAMAVIPDLDRTPFENVSKGVHDFSEEELERLHKAALEVSEVLKSVNARAQKRMAASFRQMG